MIRHLVTLLLASTVATCAHAQGCSDAGICTAGSIKQLPEAKEDSARHIITLSAANGWGDDHVFVCTPALQYTFRPTQTLEIDAKISAGYASGSLGRASGPGDILIDVVKTAKSGKKYQWSFVAVLKIPLSNSDLKKGKLSLPMQYQSSLGTYDIIAGATVAYRHWLLSAGYQQPLTVTNGNMFMPSLWADHKADVYPPSDQLHRRADVLLKAGYGIACSRRWEFTPGVLAIYHLGEDEYYDVVAARRLSLKGSGGVTVNLTVNANYSTAKWSAGVIIGTPIAVRDIRPDGLTRSLVLLPQFSYKL